jgi:poly-gamma-glutamate capsule biosynthesis protein CapA/YwtB (metallophosphatase superfamily)
VGQGEVVFTDRVSIDFAHGHAPPCKPANMAAVKEAGFNIITLAGNHVYDSGTAGIEDTLKGFKALGIPTTGAGLNLEEARQPAFVEKDGVRFGFLSYNCVGPKDAWASKDKAGCAYVYVMTHYELDYANPGGPPTIYTFCDPATVEAMENDIQRLRPQCDVLAVCLHKGLVHTPVKLAMYERPLSHAAVNAGADIIIGHHAHILHGIEIYKGKPIFHGLCNLVTITKALTMEGADNEARKIWVARRKKIFGFEPDPNYPNYPFHPEAIHTMIAKCLVENGKITRVAYLPCMINTKGQPEVLKRDQRGEQVFDYVQKITAGAGLKTRFEWDGDEVVILEG